MTRPALCLSGRCTARGQHHPDCTDDTCPGCTPRLAADGVLLCTTHLRHLGEDPVAAARLHTELAHNLTGSNRPGEPTSGSPNRDRTPDPRAVEARSEIRQVLVSWSLMIAEELGMTLPADDIDAIGAYVARHAAWLAARPDVAGEACDELHELAHGRARRVAYPSGARAFPVAACPHCTGTIKAVLRPAGTLPSALVCDTDPEHTWPADQWLRLGRTLRHHTESEDAA